MLNSNKLLDYSIHQISLVDIDQKFCSTGYLIRDEKTVIIETGTAPSNSKIHGLLKELEIDPQEIDAIFVTHIHLDHSGGAGLLMQQCPNATLYVHGRGIKHLVHPERLVESAKFVYGKDYKALFDPVYPVDENRIVVIGEGEDFQIGKNRFLNVYDAPGHALHHSFFFDTASKGIFSGDSAGLYYQNLFYHQGVELCLPATTPTQFDPKAMNQTLSKMMDLDPKCIYFTHFGASENAMELLQQVKEWVPLFGEEGVEFFRSQKSLEDLTSFFRRRVNQWLEERNVALNSGGLQYLEYDLKLNAQGVIAYAQRLEK